MADERMKAAETSFFCADLPYITCTNFTSQVFCENPDAFCHKDKLNEKCGRKGIALSQQQVRLESRAAIRRRVLQLAWPVATEMALQTLTQMVDMAMVGRLGAVAIASVGLSFRPLFVAQAIFIGLGTGTIALVSRAVGAKDSRGAGHVAGQSLLASLAVAGALATAAFVFARPLMIFMGGRGEVVPLGTVYIRGLAPGLLFMLVGNVLTMAYRGAGDPHTPMKVQLVANAINVAGNYVLIFGHLGFPALGVFGAAIATSFARILAAAALFWVLVFSDRGKLRLKLSDMNTLDLTVVHRLFRIGIPAAMERISMSLAFMVHTRIVAELGTLAVASATVAGSVEQLSFMPALGFTVAASTLVGQSIGARRPDRAEQSAWESAKISAVFMGGMGVLFFLWPELFVRLFTDDPSVAEPGSSLIRLVALSQVFTATAHVIAGALRGAGDTMRVFAVTAFSSWVLRVGGALLLIQPYGLTGAWAAIILDWAFQALVLVSWFQRGRWKAISV
ncbi:MAG: MATE family efflux transporter [Bacillota bacterium]